MLEFLDDYVLQTLETEWAKLVGGGEDELEPAPLEIWRQSFSARAIQEHIELAYKTFVTDSEKLVFYDAWNPTLFTVSGYTVAVSLDSQETPGEFFGHGNGGGAEDMDELGQDDFASQQAGQIGLYVLSLKKPVLSFICYFIRRAILCASLDIVQDLGIDGAHRVRSAALICPPEMAPNGVPNIYGRKLEFDAECIDVAARLGGVLAAAKKPALVAAEGDLVSSLVDRTTGAKTDLGGTFQGRFKPRPR